MKRPSLQTRQVNFNDYIIELSETDEDYKIPKDQEPWKDIEEIKLNNNYCSYVDSDNGDEDECIIDDSTDITFVFRNKKITDNKISTFIKFCCNEKLFDDTFYDYGNEFSVVATKLPDTFFVLSNGQDTITKRKFKYIFKKKYKYNGDLNHIYNKIDNIKKGHITWSDFKDFFIPFVKNITI